MVDELPHKLLLLDLDETLYFASEMAWTEQKISSLIATLFICARICNRSSVLVCQRLM